MSVTRNKIVQEQGLGLEMLRHEEAHFIVSGNNKTFYSVFGPYPCDMDVVDVVCASHVPLADNAGNAVDIYNGTVAGAVKIVTAFDPDGLVADVPQHPALVAPTSRVLAGAVVVVKVVGAGDNSTTYADLTVRVELEAVKPSYAAYDSGGIEKGTYE